MGDTVTVKLSMCCLQQPVVSYQAFLEFDSGVLAYQSGSYVVADPVGPPTMPIAVSGNAINLTAGT